DPLRLVSVLPRFPRPVGGVVVQGEQKRLLRRLSLHEVDGSVGQQIRQIPFLEDLLVAFPEVVALEAVVAEEVDGSGAMPEELLIPALERAIPGQRAEVPFADE